jgi:hypothetical protein
MSEASDAIKELGLEPKIEEISVDEVLRSAAAAARAVAGADIELVAESAPPLRVGIDKTLLGLAIAEIGASLSERAERAGVEGARTASGHTAVPVKVDQPDASTVRLIVGDWVRVTDDAAVKAPFAISGGGIRLALARTLTQMAGAGLRLEQSADGSLRYAIHLPRKG